MRRDGEISMSMKLMLSACRVPSRPIRQAPLHKTIYQDGEPRAASLVLNMPPAPAKQLQHGPEYTVMGQVDLEIGTVNSDGLRGTKAVRDMKKDQIAVHLPSQLTIPLGLGKVTPEVCADCRFKRPSD